MKFPTKYDLILEKIDAINPIEYAKTRNFKNGSVTRISPYISRGIISTQQVMYRLFENGFSINNSEKFIQELAWREYWQYVWEIEGEGINTDLRQPQPFVRNYKIAKAIIEGRTKIDAVDEGIRELYSTGYMHNHMRMYVASISCNSLGNHWLLPAKWLYYNLIDGDWASNALSWQWVSGSNSHRPYLVNQENINKYFETNQKDTFLDTNYENLSDMIIPSNLQESTNLELNTDLPKISKLALKHNCKTLIYNYYNIDPLWHKNEEMNRILLLEPSVFKDFPISLKCIEFTLEAAKNIERIQIFVGEFDELVNLLEGSEIIFKEHPLNKHYKGTSEKRDKIFELDGNFRSFSAFWKIAKKQLTD